MIVDVVNGGSGGLFFLLFFFVVASSLINSDIKNREKKVCVYFGGKNRLVNGEHWIFIELNGYLFIIIILYYFPFSPLLFHYWFLSYLD